jgi:ABC-type dipeptide/oligopeptide/nickel transport systems, permease components
MAPPNGTEAVALPVLAAVEERYWVSTLKRLARRRIALFGLAVVVIVLFAATCAPWLTPFDPLEQDINQRLKEPGWRNADGQVHPLGTDHLGRDILARVIFGSRIALIVGLSAVLISGVLGMIIGLVAGYFGGKVDDFFMRLADIQLAFPFILLAIAVIGVLGANLRNIIIVIGVSSWVVYARVVRGEVLSIRERDFVQAAIALAAATGASSFATSSPTLSRRGLWWPLSTWPASSSSSPRCPSSASASSHPRRRGAACSPTAACICPPRGGSPPFPVSPSSSPCSASTSSATGCGTPSTPA